VRTAAAAPSIPRNQGPGRVGAGAAVVLALLRLSFFLKWGLPSSWMLEAIDPAVDVTIPELNKYPNIAPLMGSSIRVRQSLRTTAFKRSLSRLQLNTPRAKR
jgi:hypothetical protein